MISFDSNISDELFAAYIDGNTTSMENSLIEKALSQDDDLYLAKEIMSSAIKCFQDLDGAHQSEDYGLVNEDNYVVLDPLCVLVSKHNELIGELDDDDDDSISHSEDGNEDDLDDGFDNKEDF